MSCDLYRFYDGDERLLYVGISLHAAQRASEHRAGKHWWTDVARMDIEHLPTREDALRAERTAIVGERPQHNVAHASDRQPSSSDRQKAERRWPDAAWIVGYGPYVCVAHCDVVTVHQYQTEQAAAFGKRLIDRGKCGHRCGLNHEVLRL